MIKYKRDVIKMMAEKGVTTYVIRKNKLFTESQLQQLRDGKLVTQDTLDKICTILDCQPGFILEHDLTDENKKLEESLLAYTKT